MSINGIVIDSRPLPLLKTCSEPYLQGLRKEMEEANEDIIDLSRKKPEFFIDEVPSQPGLKQLRH